jgi:aldehyde:ferredoxin oxidoreductase
MKFAGFDAIVVLGQAKSPVYVNVADGDAEIRNASHLVGVDAKETQSLVKKETGDAAASVACIGRAGENLVRYAAIMNDWNRAAGRTGMGAVMGSKKLKAVAVSGSQRVPVANSKRFMDVVKAASTFIRESALTQVFQLAGTSNAADYFNELGAMPSRYFTSGGFEGVYEIDGVAMKDKILTGTTTCFGCPIRCGRVVTIKEGKYSIGEVDGPEYETICGFGPNIGNTDLEGISYANNLCNLYGLDTISTSVAIGFAFYLFEKGILTTADTGGLRLEWGNIGSAIQLIELIAERKGIGDALAEGVRALGQRYGVPEYAVHVKGLELPFHDPRGLNGMAIGYAAGTRGACHNFSTVYLVEAGQIAPELGIITHDPKTDDGKAELSARSENLRAVYNSMIMCIFANPPVEHVAALIETATGHAFRLEDLMLYGERMIAMKRIFNNRMGMTRKDDALPQLLTKPLTEGGARGNVPDLERQLREYYSFRGWDLDTGRPAKTKLKQLGVGELAAYLPN